MYQNPEQVDEIRQQMRERGVYTELDEQCEASRKVYEAVLMELTSYQRAVIEEYVELLNRCNFKHMCNAFLMGREEGKATKEIYEKSSL